jgi:hypothetical protein
MYEQTNSQLHQIQKQLELLAHQANEIQKRKEISEKIYQSKMSFEPFIGHVYHLYEKHSIYHLMMIGPDEWGRSKNEELQFVQSVKLLSDFTWELI